MLGFFFLFSKQARQSGKLSSDQIKAYGLFLMIFGLLLTGFAIFITTYFYL